MRKVCFYMICEFYKGKFVMLIGIFFKMADISLCNESVNKEKRNRNRNLLPGEEEMLAEQVRLYPALYDKADPAHKERDVLKNAWDAVAEALDFVDSGKFLYYIVTLKLNRYNFFVVSF